MLPFCYITNLFECMAIYLLKKLQETRGAVTFGELGDYISREVSRRSVVVNAKGQTPAVVVSPRLADSWRQIPLGK